MHSLRTGGSVVISRARSFAKPPPPPSLSPSLPRDDPPPLPPPLPSPSPDPPFPLPPPPFSWVAFVSFPYPSPYFLPSPPASPPHVPPSSDSPCLFFSSHLRSPTIPCSPPPSCTYSSHSPLPAAALGTPSLALPFLRASLETLYRPSARSVRPSSISAPPQRRSSIIWKVTDCHVISRNAFDDPVDFILSPTSLSTLGSATGVQGRNHKNIYI